MYGHSCRVTGRGGVGPLRFGGASLCWGRIHTFNSLVDVLYELVLQRKSDATLKYLHSMAHLKWLDGNINADSNAPMNQEEAFAHSLCEECFVSFQQARGQANGNRGGGGRGRGKG